MIALLRRSAVFPAAVLLFLLVAAACTSAGEPSAGGQPSALPSSIPSNLPAESVEPPPDYPITLTDDEGTEVDIAKRPARIVSLQPAVTETLFALGAGDRVVGKVEDIFAFPPEADELPIVATYQGVDVEKVVGLEPDLVIAGGKGGNPPEDIAQLRELEIPVLVVYADSVDGVLTDIELIGAAVGEPEEAATITAGIAEDISAIEAAAADLPKPRTFYEIDATSDIYGPADGSFLAELIELAGGDPITTGSTDFTPIPLETLVTADPEVIVLGDAAYGVTTETVAGRAGWDVMTALRDGAIRPVDDVVVTRPGPRIAAGLASLARAIHPDIVLPD
jgi:iron complex transport system substrate-binding protein